MLSDVVQGTGRKKERKITQRKGQVAYGHRGREIDAGELDVEHEGVALDLEGLVLDKDMLDLKDILTLDDA
jgi:hypothetical protein